MACLQTSFRSGAVLAILAMNATAKDWRPRVRAGDTLRISATYDTTRASWYEVMGIMVVGITNGASVKLK